MDRYESEKTHCDACGEHRKCARLGPRGHYTLALCGECHPPFGEQEKADRMAWAASPEAARDWAPAPMPRAW